MKDKGIFTTTGELYYHFHMIGVGVIYNYSVKSRSVIVTCEYTGQVISKEEWIGIGGLSKDEFKRIAKYYYKKAIEKGETINLDYMDDPTIVGCVGVDFDLLKN